MNNNVPSSSSSSWNPGMISIEAELQAVERDFFSGKCGAFETADAQQEVTQQLSSLKNLENQLFAQSRVLWDWSSEEQGLWQNAMHRQQQQQQNGATPSPGMMGQQQQQQMNGADQLASLFAKRDQSLKQIGDTVNLLTKSISTCCEVVSRGGTNKNVNASNNNNSNTNDRGRNTDPYEQQQQSRQNENVDTKIPSQQTAKQQQASSASPANIVKNSAAPVPVAAISKSSASAITRSPGLGPQQQPRNVTPSNESRSKGTKTPVATNSNGNTSKNGNTVG